MFVALWRWCGFTTTHKHIAAGWQRKAFDLLRSFKQDTNDLLAAWACCRETSVSLQKAATDSQEGLLVFVLKWRWITQGSFFYMTPNFKQEVNEEESASSKLKQKVLEIVLFFFTFATSCDCLEVSDSLITFENTKETFIDKFKLQAFDYSEFKKKSLWGFYLTLEFARVEIKKKNITVNIINTHNLVHLSSATGLVLEYKYSALFPPLGVWKFIVHLIDRQPKIFQEWKKTPKITTSCC